MSRRVYILGRQDELDVEEAARRAASDGVQLVLLTLGYPVTTTQRTAVERALDLTMQLRLSFDAALAPSLAEAAVLARPFETVALVASGSERKRIRRALAKRGVVVDEPTSAARAVPVMAGSEERMSSEQEEQRTEEPARTEEPEVDPGDAYVPSTGGESIEALAGREVATPVIETTWTQDEALATKRGALRVYLGSAPGVGKTYAMLSEGHRRMDRGTDVVVSAIYTYDRPKTIEMLQGLEVVPPRAMEYRGRTFEEMDVDRLVERHPEVALIDELAHTNIPGSRRAKRWEDVFDVLREGIEVITTVNAQHIASLNDVVAAVTGIRQQETVPDWVLDVADQVELVDMSPYALRRRMIHGNVYPDPRKAELALQRFFTTENLTALRELALMRVANQVDEDLLQRWSKSGAPETRERILVCVARPAISETLIRRGSRIANRTRGDLLVVFVATGDEESERGWTDRVRRLVDDLGGEFEILGADDPVDAVLSYAYQHRVTQIVVGESLRSRWQEMLGGSFVQRLIRRASNVDIHVMAEKER
jgi:nucleotide-binding universal stress UspA family protein